MRVMICDSQTQGGRVQQVATWVELAKQHGWAVSQAKSLSEVRQADGPDLALLHVSDGWHAQAWDHLRALSPAPLFVAYSGAAVDSFEPWSQCTQVPYGSVAAITANLGEVLAYWPQVPDQAWLFDTISGFGPVEVALQILSALLPIGLLWEAHDGEKGKALTVLGGNGYEPSPIEFERRIQKYACAVLGGDCTAANGMWGEVTSNHQAALDKLGGTEDIKAKLKDLCSADGPEKWNCKLRTLRDDLLAQANA